MFLFYKYLSYVSSLVHPFFIFPASVSYPLNIVFFSSLNLQFPIFHLFFLRTPHLFSLLMPIPSESAFMNFSPYRSHFCDSADVIIPQSVLPGNSTHQPFHFHFYHFRYLCQQFGYNSQIQFLNCIKNGKLMPFYLYDDSNIFAFAQPNAMDKLHLYKCNWLKRSALLAFGF